MAAGASGCRRSSHRGHRRSSDGSSPCVDSVGNHYELDNTKTQWIGPGSRTVATDGASSSPGWKQLKEIPPE